MNLNELQSVACKMPPRSAHAIAQLLGDTSMALLITPMLVIGLLVSPAPIAGECTGDLSIAARTCENCAVKVSAHGASDRLERQARKHAGYYLMLLQAQRKAGSVPAEAPEFSARVEPITVTETVTEPKTP
jgi:hypothetical protein